MWAAHDYILPNTFGVSLRGGRKETEIAVETIKIVKKQQTRIKINGWK